MEKNTEPFLLCMVGIFFQDLCHVTHSPNKQICSVLAEHVHRTACTGSFPHRNSLASVQFQLQQETSVQRHLKTHKLKF